MNILFFLTPKATCTYLYSDFTIRQALERMEKTRYAAIPILNRDGSYAGTLTEGDLLWAIKNLYMMNMREAEKHTIMEISRRLDNEPVSANTNIDSVLTKAIEQNFVPVVDDKDAFIGIVTRKSIMQYCQERLFRPADEAEAAS